MYTLLRFVLFGYNLESKAISNDNYETFFSSLKKVLQSVNELHTKHLSILPRPSEPVELTRFERVIHKQIVQLTDSKLKKDISISLNEDIGEKVYGDNLFEFKRTIEEFINEDAQFRDFVKYSSLNKNSSFEDNERINITIPRIDASNTFRWPSLIHEMCHSLFQSVKFNNNNNIVDEFLCFVDGEENVIYDEYFHWLKNGDHDTTKSKLYHWLEECWSDLFACILIGPSLYFSQFIVFLNVEEKVVTPTHPPHEFRLDLIESIISHRFLKLYNEILADKYIASCEELTTLLQDDDSISFKGNPNLTKIFIAFDLFFKSHFLPNKKEGGVSELAFNPEISASLNKLVNKYVRIHPEVIRYLVDRLKQGLPIPSIKTKTHGVEYEEIPTYVQEIFLASWISRFEDLIPKVLKTIEDSKIEDIVDNIKDTFENIKKLIMRHDQAILKSIQVSEWFDFLIKEKRRLYQTP
ncbi:MAG: hypothetical protein IPM69_13625 [Ignavibacteria bacterium]|nr:hypothetical protein [Ignavibacteria bacterium]